MSHDIMPGLVGGATAVASPGQTGSAATGPPGGDAGLSALFASLLAGSGGPGAKTGVIPAARAGVSPALKGPGERQDSKAAPGGIPIFPPPSLPIKLNPGTIPTQPTMPPTADVAAETQNAMDTSPVSGPRTKAETKPGGELPLSETRTPPSVALPAPPVFFIAAPPAPAAGTPAVPAVTPPASGPFRPLTSGLSGSAPSALAEAFSTLPPDTSVASSAVPPSVPMLAAQALPPASAVTPAPAAWVPGEAARTPSDLPQTFTLPAAAEAPVARRRPGRPNGGTGRPVPAALVRPSAGGTDGPPERAAPPVFLHLAASGEPYTLTGSALTVSPQALAARPSSATQAAEAGASTEVVTETARPAVSGPVPSQPVLTVPTLTPAKVPAAALPALKGVGAGEKCRRG